MANSRSEKESVDAFSAPKHLLVQVKEEATRRGLTKSGFIRFCLAKAVGWDDESALNVAQHGAIRHLAAGGAALSETPAPFNSSPAERIAAGEKKAVEGVKSPGVPVKYGRSPKAASPSGNTSGPRGGAGKGSKSRP